MDIIIVADFCGEFNKKGNNRFLYIAERLIEKGHTVEIVTSDFSHGLKKHFDGELKGFGYKLTMLREPGYNKNVSIKRFISHYIWGINVNKYLKHRKKPEVIYVAIPTLKAATEVGRYCNKNNLKCVVDIQDLWPEGFRMIVNIPVISDIAFFPFNIIANEAYRRADAICAVSKTYAERAMKINKKCTQDHTVFIGTDLSDFDENKNLKYREKEKDEIWLGYCGSLGSSYDLICVFNALKLLGERAPTFIVMGDGPRRKEFEKKAKELGLNVEFTGMLPYREMCSLLSECDIAVNSIAHRAAGSIINKHGDYAAAGLPVINNQECVEYRKLVEDYQMGLNCNNNDPVDMAEKILLLINNEKMRKSMGRNARKCAEAKFDRKKTYDKLLEQIICGKEEK